MGQAIPHEIFSHEGQSIVVCPGASAAPPFVRGSRDLELVPCRSFASTCRRGKSGEFRRAISQSIQAALVETFDVPEQDLFQIISEHAAESPIVHAPSYLGIDYSDELTIIQLTVSDTRSLAQKRRLFARIAERLASAPGLRPEDVFINPKFLGGR
jgi:4-oxalocrotonate tautomerase